MNDAVDGLRRLGDQLNALCGKADSQELLRNLLAPIEKAFRDGAGPSGVAAPASLQQATLTLSSWTALAAQRGVAKAVGEARARVAAGLEPLSLRAGYELLAECGDRAWLEIAEDDDFASALGNLVNEYAHARLGDRRHDDAGAGPLPAPDTQPSGLGLETLFPEPARLLDELDGMRQRLAAASQTLAGLGNVAPGATPRHEAWSNDLATLYRMGDEPLSGRGPAVLLVYALVNREHVLDLEHGRSFVRRLIDAGLDVWLLAWRPPESYQPELTLERYADETIGAALQAVRDGSRRQRVALIGICQGGTLALCHVACHPRAAHRLVTIVTPVDFHADGFLLGRWLRHVDVDLLVDAFGNVPGEWLNAAFLALRPLQLGSRKYVDALDRLQEPAQAASFLRMERWLNDSPDQAGEAFRVYARDLVQANGFVNASLQLGGRRVDLRAVRCPLLNIAAARDHIVPTGAALALGELVGSRHYRAEVVNSGHIGLFASRHAAGVARRVADFVRAPSGAAAMTV